MEHHSTEQPLSGKSADINANSVGADSMLYLATSGVSLSLAQVLQHDGAEVEERMVSQAAARGEDSMLELIPLSKIPVNVNFKTTNEQAPLLQAVAQGDQRIAKLLLESACCSPGEHVWGCLTRQVIDSEIAAQTLEILINVGLES